MSKPLREILESHLTIPVKCGSYGFEFRHQSNGLVGHPNCDGGYSWKRQDLLHPLLMIGLPKFF
jgi:hypothetical protein